MEKMILFLGSGTVNKKNPKIRPPKKVFGNEPQKLDPRLIFGGLCHRQVLLLKAGKEEPR